MKKDSVIFIHDPKIEGTNHNDKILELKGKLEYKNIIKLYEPDADMLDNVCLENNNCIQIFNFAKTRNDFFNVIREIALIEGIKEYYKVIWEKEGIKREQRIYKVDALTEKEVKLDAALDTSRKTYVPYVSAKKLMFIKKHHPEFDNLFIDNPISIWVDENGTTPTGHYRCTTLKETKEKIRQCEKENKEIAKINCNLHFSKFKNLFSWLARRRKKHHFGLHFRPNIPEIST